jgi:predicted kinase
MPLKVLALNRDWSKSSESHDYLFPIAKQYAISAIMTDVFDTAKNLCHTRITRE